jgi:hypothetical protein
MKWFKPKPIEEAEYEFALQRVQLMADAQKSMNAIVLYIPVQNIQPDFIEDIATLVSTHKGTTPLNLIVFDEIKQHVITLSASPIHMSKQFYHWLNYKKMEEVLDFKVK